MITQKIGIVARTPSADHRAKEGYVVVMSSDTAVLGSSATAVPFGVIAEGENTDGLDTLALIGSGLVALVKLSGTVAEGAKGQIHSDGQTFVTDAGSGNRVVCCKFLKAGVSGDLIPALLIGEQYFAS